MTRSPWTEARRQSFAAKRPAAFWRRVDQSCGPDECWPWTGQAAWRGGYGTVHYEGRSRRAHRIAYELTHGPIPDGLEVMHSCDNPPCVNPAHLRVGTHAENMADKVAKGRAVGTSKPKPRCRRGHDRSPENLIVSRLGVRQCRPCRRTADASRARARGVPPARRVSDEVRLQMATLHAAGLIHKQIALIVGFDASVVCRQLQRHRASIDPVTDEPRQRDVPVKVDRRVGLVRFIANLRGAA